MRAQRTFRKTLPNVVNVRPGRPPREAWRRGACLQRRGPFSHSSRALRARGCRFAAAGQTTSGNAARLFEITKNMDHNDITTSAAIKKIISAGTLTDDIRLPFWERSVSFEPRAGRVSPRQRAARLLNQYSPSRAARLACQGARSASHGVMQA